MLVMAESFLTIPNFSRTTHTAADTLTECIRAVGVYVRERLKTQEINLKANIAGRKNAINTNNENIDENSTLPVNDFAESVCKMITLVDPLMTFGGSRSNDPCYSVLRAQTLKCIGTLLTASINETG